MGFEELAALKQQLSKRAQADKPQRSQAERPAREAQASQGAQGRVQGTKPSAAPGAPSSKPRNASATPGARSGAADGAARNRHRHGETGKPGNGGFAGRRPAASPTAAPAGVRAGAPTADQAGAERDASATPRKSTDAQRGPRPPRPEKRTQPPVEPVVITIGQLQKRFPLAFPKNPAPKSPLKLGISKDLIAQAETLALSEADLLEAIKVWCQGSRYWAAMTKGAARVNLEGQPDGIVTPEQAAHARSLAAASRRAKHGIVPKKKGEASAQAAAIIDDAASTDAASAGSTAGADASGQAASVTSADAPATATPPVSAEATPSATEAPVVADVTPAVTAPEDDAAKPATASETMPTEQAAHSSASSH